MATYRVSEFAKLAQVSVRLLHHYDRIGLLKPAFIDPMTSYRRYELVQLHRLNRILALRDLGFSLTQIAEMISQDISPEQVRTMYEQKSHELREQIARDSLRLAQAELRLQYIEAEAQQTVPDIILKKIEAVPALVVRTQFYSVPEISTLFMRTHKALESN
jgi:DNA-binding transcriptional MerR regulator